jgi:glycosyltransferase involved in cell wall biosynthesis
MAMGKPILIGVEGEAAEFVTTASAGVAVPSDDVDAMADAMVRLSQMPRERLADMGRHGREAYWRTFSFATAIAKTDAAFRDVIESAHGESSRTGL